jgi:hypothetical protein
VAARSGSFTDDDLAAGIVDAGPVLEEEVVADQAVESGN